MRDQLQTQPEVVFIPKFKWTVTVGPLLFLLTIPLGLAMLAENNFRDLAMATIFASCWMMGALVPLILPRRLRFGPRELIVEKMFGRKAVIPYSRITDIGYGAIVVRDGWNVPLRELKNEEELNSILERLVESGVLPVDQFEGTLDENMATGLKAMLWVVPLSMAAGIAVVWNGWYPADWDPKASVALTMMIVVAVFGAVLHIVQRRKSAT